MTRNISPNIWVGKQNNGLWVKHKNINGLKAHEILLVRRYLLNPNY